MYTVDERWRRRWESDFLWKLTLNTYTHEERERYPRQTLTSYPQHACSHGAQPINPWPIESQAPVWLPGDEDGLSTVWLPDRFSRGWSISHGDVFSTSLVTCSICSHNNLFYTVGLHFQKSSFSQHFLQKAQNYYFWVRCQNSCRVFSVGCYSDLKSSITTFVSYFQTKNSKGTFFYLPGSFPSGLERRERTAWISFLQHIICFFRHTCHTAFQMKACSPLTASKASTFGFRWQTWEFLVF